MGRILRCTLPVLVLLATIFGLSLGVATTAQAQPTCTGFGRLARTVHPLTDEFSETSGLVPSIDKLICSAADGATVDIKSWFIRVDDPVVTRLVAHLGLMHRYHRVQVNVHVGLNAYPPYRRGVHTYAHLRQVMSFAHVYGCLTSCWLAHEGTISHSKWITVSRLRSQADPATLSTSSNWSHQQFRLTRQTGLLTIGHPDLYRAFTGRFAVYVDCAVHAHCHRTAPPAHWVGSPGAWVYFAPATTDPIADQLLRLQCSPGSHVDITSLMLTRVGVLRAIDAVRQRGCAVRVLLQQPVTAALNSSLHPRCEVNHDKSIVITTPTVRVVIAGSEDFGGGGLHGNDNVMVSTTSPTVYRGYQSFFNANWAHAHGCPIAH